MDRNSTCLRSLNLKIVTPYTWSTRGHLGRPLATPRGFYPVGRKSKDHSEAKLQVMQGGREKKSVHLSLDLRPPDFDQRIRDHLDPQVKYGEHDF